MTHTEDSAQKDATNKIKNSEGVVIKPLRTMRGDLAELLAKNTLTPLELKSIRIQLQNEARAYHAQGGDDRYLESLLPQQKNVDINTLFSGTGIKNKPESEADLFIQKTTAEIIAEQIPKSRQKTEEIKQTITQKEIAPPAPPPTPPRLPLPPAPPVSTPTIKKEEPPHIQRPPQIKTPEVDPLITEEKDLARSFSIIPEKERAISDVAKKLATERASFEGFLAPLLEEERVLEDKENSLHLEEARSRDVTTRRHLEEERWQIEDRRRSIEQKRWKIDQELVRIQNDLNTLEVEKKKIANEKEKLDERKNILEKKKRARTAHTDYTRLKEELGRFAGEKDPLEISWIELSEKRKTSLNELEHIRAREVILEETIAESEVAEHKTQTPEERHAFEARRWKAEEERRLLEKNRWALEDSLVTLEESAKMLKEKYQKILSRENDTKKQMEDLQKLMNEVRHLI